MSDISSTEKAVYAGSFDPLTKGHLDILIRARRIFSKVIVAVADNRQKNSLFSVSERVEMISSVLGPDSDIEIDSFDGLLVDYCQENRCSVIIRGLRAVSDYEYESKLAITNRQLCESIETVFLMTSKDYSFISSSTVREIASLGGNVTSLVPEFVEAKLREKF